MKLPKDWKDTMAPAEVAWCLAELKTESYDYDCVNNFRAARARKSSQVRRFQKQEREGCCGSRNWIAWRFNPMHITRNWKHWGFDKYLLGFNYGH